MQFISPRKLKERRETKPHKSKNRVQHSNKTRKAPTKINKTLKKLNGCIFNNLY